MLLPSQPPEHGRTVQVDITGTGRELLAKAHKLVGAVEDTVTRAVSTAEEQVSGILEKCRVALETT